MIPASATLAVNAGTIPGGGPRVPADEPRYNATLRCRVDLTETLSQFWVRFDGEPADFVPGQYMTIGVVADGQLIQRPYSVASLPSAASFHGYEFLIRRVPEGAFTSLLWQLPIGHRVRLFGPKGRFVLDPEEARPHLFVSSGTAVAPFVAMLRAMATNRRAVRTVLVQGVSYVRELAYRRDLETLESDGSVRLRYVPTVSRPNHRSHAGWAGEVGRAEAVLERVFAESELLPDHAVAFLCGNPGMVAASRSQLLARGFPDQDVRTEQYWTNRVGSR